MIHVRIVVAAAVIGVSALAQTAAAQGVLVASQITTDGKTTTTQTQIEKTRMRTEITDPTGDSQVVIFDGTKQVLYMVYPAKKSYVEITKADVDRMAGMMSQLQAQLASLPPAQRAQMEAMMRGRGMGGAPEKTLYKRNGSGRGAKWACDRYDGFRGAEKVGEICTVPPGTLGFTAADFEVSRQMVEFLRALAPQNADQTFAIGTPDAQGFSGVPVRSSMIMNGRTTTTEVTDVSRQTFPATLFAIPAGFQKGSFGVGMPGAGR